MSNRPFTTNCPLEKAILITAMSNYKALFKDHLKESKDNGFMSDSLIQSTIKSIESKLHDTVESE